MDFGSRNTYARVNLQIANVSRSSIQFDSMACIGSTFID